MGEEKRGEREKEREEWILWKKGKKWGGGEEEGERGRVISDILLQLGIRKRKAKRGGVGWLFVAAFN